MLTLKAFPLQTPRLLLTSIYSLPMAAEIRPPAVMSEIDLAIVHALQVAPRAPWKLIGSIVGLDAATTARHWGRLSQENVAWFTVRASARLLTPTTDAAIVRVQVAPEQALTFATELASHEEVVAVDLVSGSAQIMFIVVGQGIDAVREHVTTLLAGEPSIQAWRYDFLALVHREDSQWQLRILSEAQKRQLHNPLSPSEREADPDHVHRLIGALQDDARLSFAALAEHLGTSEATARRMLSRALEAEGIRLGCDVATQAVGLGRSVVIEARAKNPREAASLIAKRPEVVRCAEIVASGNLLVMVRLATLAQLSEFETDLQQQIPDWDVRDRLTVTRVVKRQGRLLDSVGRALPFS